MSSSSLEPLISRQDCATARQHSLRPSLEGFFSFFLFSIYRARVYLDASICSIDKPIGQRLATCMTTTTTTTEQISSFASPEKNDRKIQHSPFTFASQRIDDVLLKATAACFDGSTQINSLEIAALATDIYICARDNCVTKQTCGFFSSLLLRLLQSLSTGSRTIIGTAT